MSINEFKLERYFAQYEFSVKYLFSASDCETRQMSEMIGRADKETAILWDELKLGYTESQGHPLLREAIAAQYENIKANDILVAMPEEAILIALHALLKKGDEVIVVDPAYQSLAELPRYIGCKVISWPIEIRNGAWTIDPEILKHIITNKTKMVIANFPHNPTGFIPSNEIYTTVLELVEKNGLYLLSDEMYRFLEHDSSNKLSPAADCYDKAITLGGLSKSFGLPGLRIGWLAATNRDIMNRLKIWKDYTSICSSAPSEILAVIALRNREQMIRESMVIIKDNLLLAKQLFRRYQDILTWYEPLGGSIAFPGLVDKISVNNFCHKAIDKYSLMILPAEIFNYCGNHFRVGIGRKNFPNACEVMEKFIMKEIMN